MSSRMQNTNVAFFSCHRIISSKYFQKQGLAKKYASKNDYAHKIQHGATLANLDPDEIPAYDSPLMLQEKYQNGLKKYYIGATYERIPSHKFQLKSLLDCVNANITTTQNAIGNWYNHCNSLLD